MSKKSLISLLLFMFGVLWVEGFELTDEQKVEAANMLLPRKYPAITSMDQLKVVHSYKDYDQLQQASNKLNDVIDQATKIVPPAIRLVYGLSTDEDEKKSVEYYFSFSKDVIPQWNEYAKTLSLAAGALALDKIRTKEAPDLENMSIE